MRSGLIARIIHSFCSGSLFFHSCGNFSFSGVSLSMNFFQRFAEPSMSRSKFLNSSVSDNAYTSPKPAPLRLRLRLRIKRYRYCSGDIATISDLFSAAEESLFKRVLKNELHLLQPLLPAKTSFSYNLRPRYHDRQLIRKSAYVNDSCFITRMLHSNSY